MDTERVRAHDNDTGEPQRDPVESRDDAPGADRLRRQLRQTGYEAGAALLSPRAASWGLGEPTVEKAPAAVAKPTVERAPAAEAKPTVEKAPAAEAKPTVAREPRPGDGLRAPAAARVAALGKLRMPSSARQKGRTRTAPNRRAELARRADDAFRAQGGEAQADAAQSGRNTPRARRSHVELPPVPPLSADAEGPPGRAALERQRAQLAAASRQLGETTKGAARAEAETEHQEAQAKLDELRAKLESTREAESARLAAERDEAKAKLAEQLATERAELSADAAEQQAQLADEIACRDAEIAALIAEKELAAETQLETERQTHETAAADETAQVAGLAQAEAERAIGEGERQATAVREESEVQATAALGQADGEAQTALQTGTQLAAEAKAAAEQRASQLCDDAERASVLADGEGRAAVARQRAAERAWEIQSMGRAAATQLREEGRTTAAALQTGAERQAQQIEVQATAEQQQLAETLEATLLALEQRAAEGAAALAEERQGLVAALREEEATARCGIAEAVATAEAEFAASEQAGVADIESTFSAAAEQLTANIETRLQEVETGKVRSLEALEKQVERTCQEVDQTLALTEAKLDQALEQATQAVAGQNDRAALALDEGGRAALATLDAKAQGALAQVEQQSAATTQALGDLSATAHAELRAEGARAQAGLLQQGTDAVAQVQQDGAEVHSDIVAQAQSDRLGLAKEQLGLAADIQEGWAQAAAAEADQSLAGTWPIGIVTDGAALSALNRLTGLPAPAQRRAIDRLSGEGFTTLLDEVPAERRGEFETLYHETDDPVRRLKLWGESHKAQGANAAEANREDTSLWDTSPADQQREHRNAQRARTADATAIEVDDEVGRALVAAPFGGASKQQVDALARRKGLEAAIEQRYGVNLTNDRGGSQQVPWPSERRIWNETELAQLETALSRVPAEHVRDNPALHEILRADDARARATAAGPWVKREGVLAEAGQGVVRLFDAGAAYDPALCRNANPATMRTEPLSELAGHLPPGTGAPARPAVVTGIDRNAPTSRLDEVLTHELGHTVHQGDPGLWQSWLAAGSWEELNAKTLLQRLEAVHGSNGGAFGRVALLEALRDSPYDVRPTETDGKRTYEVDPYGEGYWGYETGSVPPGVAHGYARSAPEEDFAEGFTKAIHQPEKFHEDLVATPERELQAQERAVRQCGQALNRAIAAGAGPAVIAQLETDVAKSRAQLEQQYVAAANMRKKWDMMRGSVLGVDDRDIQALAAPPGKEAIYAEFKRQAALCATPEQLTNLRARYAHLL